MPSAKPNVLVTMPDDFVRAEIFPAEQCARLEAFAEVTYNPTDKQYTPEQMAQALVGKQAALTGWGTPCFTADVLAKAKDLAFIGHAAGSVGSLVSDAVYDRGIAVTTANDVMARQVAEFNMMLMLMGLRNARFYCEPLYKPADQFNWQSGWYDKAPAKPLLGAKVGIIGLGAIARWVIRMTRPFDADIMVFSRHASADEAADLGVRLVDIEELLKTSDVIHILCGLTPKTRHLLNADRLALIKDGAVLINTGRGAIIDEPALYEALKSGRFTAALDVFDPEPIRADNPLRTLPNILLSPHIAGYGNERNYSRYVIDELKRFIASETLLGAIPRNLWANMTVHEMVKQSDEDS